MVTIFMSTLKKILCLAIYILFFEAIDAEASWAISVTVRLISSVVT